MFKYNSIYKFHPFKAPYNTKICDKMNLSNEGKVVHLNHVTGFALPAPDFPHVQPIHDLPVVNSE